MISEWMKLTFIALKALGDYSFSYTRETRHARRAYSRIRCFEMNVFPTSTVPSINLSPLYDLPFIAMLIATEDHVYLNTFHVLTISSNIQILNLVISDHQQLFITFKCRRCLEIQLIKI